MPGRDSEILTRTRALERKLSDATLEALRVRAMIDASDNPKRDRWQRTIDKRIRLIVAAWCDDPIRLPHGSVNVFETPVEAMFPLERLDSATGAFCSGLVVGDKYVFGSVWGNPEVP